MLLLVLTSCGRIGFEPLPSDGASTARCDPTTTFTSIQSVAELNTNFVDGGLRLSHDELTAYFHSDRSGMFEIYSATRPSQTSQFGLASTLFPGATFISFWPGPTADGLQLAYNIAGPATDLLISTRATTNDAFVPGVAVAGAVGGESCPMIGSVTSTLYFARVTTNEDLMRVPLPAGLPATPIAELDTAMDEQSPTLSEDELVIYFSRADPKLDIWVAQRSDTQSPFGSPVPVGELNTNANDSPTWLSPDMCRLYIESERAGSYDLYVAERTP
jgi:hypothetical protein